MNYKILFTLVSLSIFFMACTFLSQTSISNIYDKPDKVVKAYLSALATKNREQILALVAPHHDAEAAINDKLNKYGGLKLENVQIMYQPTENPYNIAANLHADSKRENGSKVTIDDILHLQREGNQWFLVLGVTTDKPVKPIIE